MNQIGWRWAHSARDDRPTRRVEQETKEAIEATKRRSAAASERREAAAQRAAELTGADAHPPHRVKETIQRAQRASRDADEAHEHAAEAHRRAAAAHSALAIVRRGRLGDAALRPLLLDAADRYRLTVLIPRSR